MKVNYTLNENNVIIGFQMIPFDESKPYLELENPHEEIHCGFSTVIDGVFNANTDQYNAAKTAIQERQTLIQEMLICKENLTQTDYKIIKHMEGIEIEDYDAVVAQRAEWRARINEIEALLNN